MGNAPRGTIRGTPGSPDGVLWVQTALCARARATKDCPLTSRNEREGRKLESVWREWGRAPRGPSRGAPMEIFFALRDIDASVVHYSLLLYDKY